MGHKITKIFVNAIPVLIMIGLIPLISNDYLLALSYLVIILISLLVKYHKKEFTILIAGFLLMLLFEYLFVSTGVETFNRQSLFGIMPIWLPLLWAYGFVAIKRSAVILST